MEINILYLSNIESYDKKLFKLEIEKIFNIVQERSITNVCNNIVVIKEIEDFYNILKGKECIFKECIDVIKNHISHLTVYFTSENKIEHYIIVKDSYISNFSGKSDINLSKIRLLIYKELLKLKDDSFKIENGLSELIFNFNIDFKMNLKTNANIIMKEYISSKDSCFLNVYKEFFNIDNFVNEVVSTKKLCDKIVERNIDNLSKCYEDIEICTIKLLKITATIIGIIHGFTDVFGEEFTLADRAILDNNLKKTYFRNLYYKLENELPLCHTVNAYKLSEKNLEGISKIIMDTLLELGLEYAVV